MAMLAKQEWGGDVNSDLFGQQSPQSKGGSARAAKLTGEARRAIAAKAAGARWGKNSNPESDTSLPRAVAEGELKFGDISIPCAVLADGRRVVSERGFGKALGRVRGGRDWSDRAARDGGQIPYFLAQKSLIQFIQSDLGLVSYKPIEYKPLHGGRVAYGTPAELIPNVCDVYLKAREAIKLNDSQRAIAAKADIIVRALARVGITALVDEATGYQYVRDRTDLQRILAAYISEELLPWANRFPREFFKEMFRLWNWQWPVGGSEDKSVGPRGPRYAGKLIKQLVYEKLPNGVLSEIESRNPPDENWQKKDRNHQWLSDEIGQPHLDKQVAVVTTLMRISSTKTEFLKSFARAFPKPKDGNQPEML